MKVETNRTPDEWQLIVLDVPSELHQKLRDDYYTQDGDRFIRSYPLTAPHADRAAKGYMEHGQAYLEQVFLERPIDWQTALRALLDRFQGKVTDWLLIGSTPLAIRGINLQPKGIDLVCQMKDRDLVSDLLADVTIYPFADCDGWVAQAFGVAHLHAPISIAFGPQGCLDDPNPIDSGPYAIANAKRVEWEGFEVPIPPIELSLEINRKRGRLDRVQMIEAYMSVTP